MLRVLLIVWLALAAPLQAIVPSAETGDADTTMTMAADMTTATAVIASDATGPIVEDATKHCCDEAKLADKRGSTCKSDCKFLVSSLTVPPVKAVFEHGGIYAAPDTSFWTPVDLRPPIS
ncbi:MAG: hypothetical protein AAGD23_06195 [Pseudomonadota bacterium]